MVNDERIQILKDILSRLHQGDSPESVQDLFNEHFSSVSAIEIAGMEQEIISDDTNDITFEDVLKMCDVHANMFKGAVDEAGGEEIDHPGHPVRVFKDENIALRSALLRIANIIKALKDIDLESENNQDIFQGLQNQMNILGQFDRHYQRKERLFFPKLEQSGRTAPPKVMWAKDDEIRDEFNDFKALSQQLPKVSIDDLEEAYLSFRQVFEDMIFKEEAILINMLLEVLTTQDWYQIAKESDAYGFAIIAEPDAWVPDEVEEDVTPHEEIEETTPNKAAMAFDQATNTIETDQGYLHVSWEPKQPASPVVDQDQLIHFENGKLNLKQIAAIFDHLPIEVTFVNKEDVFQYFNNMTNPKNMIFKRTKGQLNRDIELCHPPKVWPKVSQLIEDLKAGRRSSEQMWYQKDNGEFIHVSYIGLHDENGDYLGILELVQDISYYRNLPSPMKVHLSDISDETSDKE